VCIYVYKYISCIIFLNKNIVKNPFKKGIWERNIKANEIIWMLHATVAFLGSTALQGRTLDLMPMHVYNSNFFNNFNFYV